jgi:hypothetical protein
MRFEWSVCHSMKVPCGRQHRTWVLPPLVVLFFASSPIGAQTTTSQPLIYTLKSGNSEIGGSDLEVWVQGSSVPRFGVVDSGLPLQHPFVIPTLSTWADVPGARWVGPSRTGTGAPEGYEYFTLFAVPPGFPYATLDVVWRADDAAELAVNGTRLPVRWASFSPSEAPGEFHGEIASLLTLGMNRLQFFVSNARVGVNPTGVAFSAKLTLSPVYQGPSFGITVAGLSSGPFDPARTRIWHFHRDNPILRPEGELEMQAGEGNIYAPDVHRIGNTWTMFYGGQGRDGHDRIFRAESEDGIQWKRAQGGQPVIDVNREGEGANHVNDPSAVLVNGRWEIFYSRAQMGEADLIDRAVNGTVDRSILPLGVPGAWDSFKVGRPSVLFEDGLYKMWYDANASSPLDARQPDFAAGRHVGFATSRDGVRWTKHPRNPVLRNSGAVDVKHIGKWYVLVQESREGTQWALGTSETDFTYQGLLLPISGNRYDRYGHVTPNLYVEGDRLVALYFGAAQGKDGDPAADWNRHRIGVAYLQKGIVLQTLDGQTIPVEVFALDADRAEVRIPETLRGKSIILQVLSEDGKTPLSRSDPLPAQPDLRLRFDGFRVDRSPN